MNKTLEQAIATARSLPEEQQDVVAFYVEQALANQPVNAEDVQTLRGLQQALAGDGYDEAEARARMEAHLATLRTS